MESRWIDAWPVALGKEDLLQKEEWKKSKNWLVGNENGAKNAAFGLSPYDKPKIEFQDDPKMESRWIDAWPVALGKEDLLQKEEWKKSKNWLVGNENGAKNAAFGLSPYDKPKIEFQADPKMESRWIDAWPVALGKEDLLQKEEWKKSKNWLVGNENGAKNAAFGLSPYDKPKIEFQADPKMESRWIDAWPVALGKEDLLQKEEWKKSKNWLVGNENGAKNAAFGLSPYDKPKIEFQADPKMESRWIDAWPVALGKEDLLQKEEWKKSKNWLVGNENGAKNAAFGLSPYDKPKIEFQADPKMESRWIDAWPVALGKEDLLQKEEWKKSKNWLVGNENGAKNAAFGLSPYDKPKIEFQADPKMESRWIDAWPVALGKEDLLQKEEWKKSKNWLVGNENGAKNAAFGLSPYDKPKIEFQADPKMESRWIDAWPVALGKEDLLQKEEWKKSKNWLVGNENGAKNAAFGLSPYDKPKIEFQADPKMESRWIDAWPVALGKEDLLQKEEWKKSKNWLVGNENGAKNAAFGLSPYDKPKIEFQADPKMESRWIDAWPVALGKEDLLQKEEWKKSKNWLVGNENGAKNAAFGLSPYDKPKIEFQADPKMESRWIDAWPVALGKEDLLQKEEWKKSKNWLVGNENGAKMLRLAYPHMISQKLNFRLIQKWNHVELMHGL